MEEILAIFLVVCLSFAGTWQLALFSNGNKAGAQSQSQTGTDEKTPRLQANDDIRFLAIAALENVELERTDEGLVQGWIDENGQDIFEQNARRREVRELAQSSAKSYLKTGEFGGAGGMGGGLSGDLGGSGIGRF